MGRKYNVMSKLLIGVIFGIFISANIFANNENVPLKITQDDMIYMAMTDRFCDGDPTNNQNACKGDPGAYHGGDFQGIIDKLDYIKDLGFTAIWISPVNANQLRGYHGYWASDFYKTNENFGSMEKLKELVRTAHSKGIKVLFDLVVNHTGVMHPWNGDPKYYDWFHHRGRISNWNDQLAIEQGDLAELPDLNQENPEVRKYLIDMAKWWIRETGIDGYRLDTMRNVPKDFWKDFSNEIKKEFPGTYLIGEVLDGRADYLEEYHQAGIDGLINYPMYYPITDVFAGYQSASRVTDAIKWCETTYSNPGSMGTFIDNFDTPRFISQALALENERIEQALAFMMTYTGIPILYYGDEIALMGGADPDNRRDMDWSVKSPLTDYVKKLTSIRKMNKALTHGSLHVVKAENECLCYVRQLGDNLIIAAFNLSDEKNRVELPLPAGEKLQKATLTELIDSKKVKAKKGKLCLTMKPRQVNIFQLSYQQ